MQKKGLFKKLGAVMMAVALTAIMIPGTVSASTIDFSSKTFPALAGENVALTTVQLEVAAPVADAEIPTYENIESGAKFYAMMHGSIGDYVCGWTLDGSAATGKFVDGKTYSFFVIINGVQYAADNKTYQATNDTVVKIGDKTATLVGVDQDTTEPHGLYKAEFTVGETASTSKITDGDDNETIKATTGKDLVLKCDKDLPDEGFRFFFGDKELTSNECKIEKGSTIVTVYATYLDTLPGGDYEVTFSYPDGNVTNTVTLTKAAAEESEEKSPKTGEFSSMTTTILLISLLGLAGLGFYAKKKEFF